MDKLKGSDIHVSVMLEEAMQWLAPRPGGLYLDGTLGMGGHAEAILSRAPDSQLCGLDQDCEALEIAGGRLAPFGGRAHLFHERFGDFANALAKLGWEKLDGAILDLGVSSLQLDKAERGFSFRSCGPLDMRMNPVPGGKSAWHLVNRGSHAELRDCIATYGEEPQAGRIARYIIEARQKQPIDTTEQLAAIARSAYPPAWRGSARRHPATRTFQALRMAVNDEIGQLKLFLDQIFDYLAINGRLVIISFHSLEDRMVKQALRRRSQSAEEAEIKLLFKKPLAPSDSEAAANPRSASAKMRAAEKVAELP